MDMKLYPVIKIIFWKKIKFFELSKSMVIGTKRRTLNQIEKGCGKPSYNPNREVFLSPTFIPSQSLRFYVYHLRAYNPY